MPVQRRITPNVLALALVTGCVGIVEEQGECVERVAQAIVLGSTSPAAVGLPDGVLAAVGALEDEYGALRGTGVLITRDWVLTAKHCSDAGLSLRLGATPHANTVRIALAAPIVHPTADLALLRVLDARSLPGATLALGDACAVGTRATLAGVGLNERLESGAVALVEETVVDVDAGFLRVDGMGRSGACTGDSGGPLIVRSPIDLAPQVVGILSRGSTDCRGIDLYTRVDSARSWIARITRPDTYCLTES